MASLYCCFWLSVGRWNRTTVVGAFLGWAFSFTRKLAVTMLWSLLNAISVLAEISRMLFLKARGAKMKSIWAKRSGDQGAVKPSVAVSLKVHFLLVGFRNNLACDIYIYIQYVCVCVCMYVCVKCNYIFALMHIIMYGTWCSHPQTDTHRVSWRPTDAEFPVRHHHFSMWNFKINIDQVRFRSALNHHYYPL